MERKEMNDTAVSVREIQSRSRRSFLKISGLSAAAIFGGLKSSTGFSTTAGMPASRRKTLCHCIILRIPATRQKFATSVGSHSGMCR